MLENDKETSQNNHKIGNCTQLQIYSSCLISKAIWRIGSSINNWDRDLSYSRIAISQIPQTLHHTSDYISNLVWHKNWNAVLIRLISKTYLVATSVRCRWIKISNFAHWIPRGKPPRNQKCDQETHRWNNPLGWRILRCKSPRHTKTHNAEFSLSICLTYTTSSQHNSPPQHPQPSTTSLRESRNPLTSSTAAAAASSHCAPPLARICVRYFPRAQTLSPPQLRSP